MILERETPLGHHPAGPSKRRRSSRATIRELYQVAPSIVKDVVEGAWREPRLSKRLAWVEKVLERHREMTTIDRFVLWRIAYRCGLRGDDGEDTPQYICFESVGDMAKGTGASPRAVQRSLRKLEQQGLIGSRTLSGKETVYWVAHHTADREVEITDATPVTQSGVEVEVEHNTPVTVSPHPRQTVTPGGDTQSLLIGTRKGNMNGNKNWQERARKLIEDKKTGRGRGVLGGKPQFVSQFEGMDADEINRWFDEV